MADSSTIDGTSQSVRWQYVPSDTIASPIVREFPYLELKLEHPDLEPVEYSDRFFPDMVPYEYDETSRVFYWRPALASSSGDPSGWKLACATTHEISGIRRLPAKVPPLVTEGANGTTVVVDGTIGGDVTTSYIESYTIPDISVVRQTRTTIKLRIGKSEYTVSMGERRRIQLSEQRVKPVENDGGPTIVTPELMIRYPGRRELHHPAKGADYRLFPSFGLDLDAVPNPVSVPTVADELDEAALADELGIEMSDRPYPERVLWQAFAYIAFDPHNETLPELTQLETEHIVLRQGRF